MKSLRIHLGEKLPNVLQLETRFGSVSAPTGLSCAEIPVGIQTEQGWIRDAPSIPHLNT